MGRFDILDDDMGLLDGPLRAVASQLMGRFGTAAILRTDYHAYNPASGQSVGAPDGYAVKGVLEDYSIRSSESGIQQGDKKFTMAAAGVPMPEPTTHALEIAGVRWSIVKVDAQMATDQAALYVLQVRR